jgi:8-oxo-dGTP pyrophosphatase MutT (NUDIX family)
MNLKKGADYTGVCVVYFCHDGGGNFVMARRSENARDEKGRWDIGGGGLEFGEIVEETLNKEIREEYGTEILKYEFLGFRDVHRNHEGRPTHWIALDFKVLVDKTRVRNAEPHKFDETGWFTLNSLPTPLHSQLPEFIERYRSQL